MKGWILRVVSKYGLFKRQAEALYSTNLRRIYPRNISALLHVPNKVAVILLELAVREGWMAKRIGLLNPNDGRMILSIPAGDPLPDNVHDEIAEAEELKSDFAIGELDIMPFYEYTPRVA